MKDKKNHQYSSYTKSQLIDKLKDVEQEYNHYQERYNALFSRSLNGVFYSDFSGKLIEANDATLKWTGYSREQIKQLSFADLISEEQLTLAQKDTEELLTTGLQKDPTEFKIKCKNGSFIWVETLGSLIYENGNPVAIQGVARNITERKNAEIQMKNRNKQLNAHSKFLFRFSTDPKIQNLTLWEKLKKITYNAANIFDVSRVSVWLLNENRTKITCQELFDQKQKKHFSGDVLKAKDYPEYFKAIKSSSAIIANDARKDKPTKGFLDGYLKPNDIWSMLDVPIHIDGKLTGVICYEQCGKKRSWTAEDESFATTMADLVNLAVVTERNKVNTRELRKSEVKYRSLYNEMPVAFFRSTPAGNLVSVNNTMVKMYGFENSRELLERPAQDFYTEKNDRKKMLQGLIKDGEVRALVTKEKKKDGTEIWVKTDYKAQKDKNGNLEFIDGIVEDVTDIIESERKLHEDRVRLNTISEHLSDMIWQLDTKLRFTYISPSVFSVLGYKPEDAIGRSFDNYFTKASLVKAKKVLVDKAKGIESQGLSKVYNEYEMIARSGELIPIEITSSVLRDKDGNIVGYSGIGRDLTERKKAEKALKISEQRLESAIESTGIGLWDQNFKTDEVFRSDNWYNMLGYKKGEIGANTLSWEYLIHPDDKAKAKQARIEHESGKTKVYKVEHRLRKKDGTYKWVLNWGRITEREDNGEPIRAVGFHIDIDDQKKSTEKIKRLEHERSLILDSLDDLFAYYDTDMNIRFVNQATVNFLNKSQKEVVGYNCKKLWHGDERKKCKDCSVQKAFKSGKPEEKQVVYKGRLFNFKAVPVKDRKGKIIGAAEFGKDITVEKQAEQKLRESEEKYRSYIDSAPDGIFIADDKGFYVDVNEAACKITGYNKDELIGKHITDLGVKDDKIDPKETFIELQKKGRMKHDVKYRKKDGSFGNWALEAVKLSETRYLGFTKDIDDRVKLEDTLKQASHIINESPVVAFRWKNDENWPVEYVSENVRRLLGYTAKEFTSGKIRYLDVIHKDDKKKLEEEVLKFSKNKKRKNWTHTPYRIISKNRKTKWIEDTTRVERDTKGMVIYYDGIIKDITERVEAEAKYKKSMERFYSIFESANEGMILLDKKGIVRDVNPAILKLAEVGSEELIGKNAISLARRFLKTRDVPKIIKQLDKLISGKGFRDIEISFKDKILEASANVDLDKYGIVAVLEDVSERRNAETKLEEYSKNLQKLVDERTVELEKRNKSYEESQIALTFLLEDMDEARKELAKANKKLEDANKDLEGFSYSVSHDLKAPLRAIDGFSQMLMEDYYDKIDEEGMRYLNVVRENTQQMGQLIQNLLDFSRAGRVKLKLNPINTKEVINEILEEFHNEIEKRNIEVCINELPEIRGDKNMIRQVFYNLVSNAVKFTGDESKPRITIGCETNDNENVYFVEDNGVGFNMKYEEKLFNVFQRLHTPDEFEGTGVGLAIVKRIVKRHGGKVSADASLNKGATFYVSLPKSE